LPGRPGPCIDENNRAATAPPGDKNMLDTLIDRYCRFINLLIALALALMVVLVFGNVVLRYAFNSGIAVSEELSRWLFVWITFWAPSARSRKTPTWAPTCWSRACRWPARSSAWC
jgi:hypothetical protein